MALITVPLLVLAGVLVATFVVLGRRAGRPGAGILAVAALPALGAAVLGMYLVSGALITLSSPAGAVMAVAALLVPAGFLAAFCALALRSKWTRYWWGVVLIPFGIPMIGLFLPQQGAVLLGGTALLAAAALLPPAAAFLTRRMLWQGLVAGLAVALLLAAPSFVAVTIGQEGGLEPQAARHSWRLEVEPAGTGAYTLQVPLFAANDSEAAEVLAALNANAHVSSGHLSFRWVNASTLEVQGVGPGVIEAEYVFYGSNEHGEAFRRYATPSGDAILASSGVAAARVALTSSFVGVGYHTCSLHAAFEARVPAGGSAPLEAGESEALCA